MSHFLRVGKGEGRLPKEPDDWRPVDAAKLVCLKRSASPETMALFVQTVRKLPEFGVKQREERAMRESERLGLIGRLTRPKAPRTPVRADRAA